MESHSLPISGLEESSDLPTSEKSPHYLTQENIIHG
jgi:hypothetical protein